MLTKESKSMNATVFIATILILSLMAVFSAREIKVNSSEDAGVSTTFNQD